MRLGVQVNAAGLSAEAIVEQVRAVAAAGLDSVYFNQLPGWDAISLAMLSAVQVPGLAVGTAVTWTYPRHPIALASQALTAQAASGNRFTLGLGPSHQPIVEGQFGYSYERQARHVREYLTALMPLLRGQDTDFHGETVTAVGRVEVPGAEPPPVLLAALGPVMLKIAGERADGTVTVWTGPQVIAEHIVPSITRAAEGAGRPAPRVVADIIMVLTAHAEAVREQLAARVGAAGQFASYRSLLDRQGMSGIHQTAVVGDERVIEQAVRAYAEAGATELVASLHGSEQDRARTLALLAGLHKRG